jgi:two-component system cell cycle response regulator
VTIVNASSLLLASSNPVPGSKVLVADDDSVTRSVLKGLLSKRGYEVIVAQDGLTAYEILQSPDAPTLAIVDWMMPGLDGIELCRKLRQSPRHAFIYIVMLSGRRDKQDFIAGLEAGADDYVGKPFDIDELHARMRAGQRVLACYEHLRSQANEDDLTGLFNRGAITEVLRRELEHASRDGTPTSLILADVDHFKQVNDVYGHGTGDAVLRELARILQASIRTYDVAGRFGGEEFLIVVPGCELSRAVQVAERLRRAVERQPIGTAEGALPITISFGVACSDGLEIEQAALIEAADMALYRAKRGGRNRVEPPPPATV